MTPQQFIAKWQRVTLSERAACQQHFLDLCELLGQPKPAEADPDGSWYTFEKGVATTEDKRGWADVWMRNHFGREYTGWHKDLKAAYRRFAGGHRNRLSRASWPARIYFPFLEVKTIPLPILLSINGCADALR